MAFASSPSTIPKPVVAIQSNSYCNLGHESGQLKSPLTRDARHAEQQDDNAHPLPPQQSSFQTDYGITAASTNLSLVCPSSSSWSIQNVSHPSPSRSPNDVKNGEPYTSSALTLPESSPLTDNNFLTSVTSKNEVPSSNSKNHVFLSSILDLKRFNPEIILNNCGSVARDHLASERTFLAYVHTSLSLSSAGVAIVQLLKTADFVISKYSEIPMLGAKMKRFAMPLGVVFQVLALFILFLGERFTLPFIMRQTSPAVNLLGPIPLVYSLLFIYMTKLTVS